jgi:hypothetical protein
MSVPYDTIRLSTKGNTMENAQMNLQELIWFMEENDKDCGRDVGGDCKFCDADQFIMDCIILANPDTINLQDVINALDVLDHADNCDCDNCGIANTIADVVVNPYTYPNK